MNPRTNPPLRYEQGVALIIVLAFVVLLTGLIIAYFSRTMADRQTSNSSFNQTNADSLAKSALDVITGDIKQELVNSGSASTSNGTTIYVNPEISLVRNGVPAKVSGTLAGSATYPIPSLLRVSSNGTMSSPGVDHYASSNALSTGTSANGRSVSPSRWNQHYLLPRQNPASTALDPTPVTSGTAAFTAPSWVYITGTGGPATPPLTTPSTSVVGRYAYAIYDEGGLLDINSAGYPCVVTSGSAPFIPSGTIQGLYTGKGALAFADLTMLSSGTVAGLTPSNVNSIVGARNYATLNSAGVDIGTFPAFSGMTTGGTTTAAGYYTAVTSNTNGFMQVSGTLYNKQTDQTFLSRQQLINLMTSSSITTTPGTSLASLQNALQYLGTFSRAVTSPSWTPSFNASDVNNPTTLPYVTGNNGSFSKFAYKNNAEKTVVSVFPIANRDLPNLRFPNPGTITHYKDDGTTTAYGVLLGDPSFQRRFSLARIGWLTHTGPATGMTQAVKDCFGLQWGSDAYGNPCWMYIHGTAPNQIVAQTTGGTTTANTILTLDVVAAQGREPDFFECLKAGILAGSLGRDPGTTNVSGTNHGVSQGCGGIFFDVTSKVTDAQIIQIGANIIDQYDSDSYPTAIFFQGNNIDDVNVPEKGPLNIFYGIENLPYPYQLRHISWYIANPDYTGYNTWMQPELWNPFQAPTVTGTNWPTSFSVQAYGAVQLRIGSSSGIIAYEKVSPQWNYDLDPYAKESMIYFKDPVPTSGTSYFANPLVVTTAQEDTSVKTTPAINRAPASGSPQAPYDSSTTYNPFLAIHTGFSPYQVMSTSGTAPDTSSTWVRDVPPGGGFVNPTVTPQPPPAMGVTFCVKYYDVTSGSFLPYAYLSRYVDVYGDAYGVSGNSTSPTDKVWGGSYSTQTPIMRADPLTDRFSASTIDGSHGPGFLLPNVSYQTSAVPGPPGELDAPWPADSSFFYDGTGSTSSIPNWPSPATKGYNYAINLHYGGWAQNVYTGATGAYYADPDGIVRPGNDCSYNRVGTIGDGVSQFKNGYSPSTGTNTGGAISNTTHTMGRRPLILNRPFRSVAELGYAYRDLPFKNLDFFTSYSADAALLDIFSVNDQPMVVSGQINPNNAAAPVLQAVLSGAGKQESDRTYNLNPEISTTGNNMATTIAGCLGNISLGNRSDLVTKLGLVISGTTIVTTGTNSVIRNGFLKSNNVIGDQANKAFLEAPVRALADVVNTRTWNLMIDVIAQTGNFSANSTDLNKNFVVQGERRYWLHIAIDRYTGKVIDQQLEPVYE